MDPPQRRRNWTSPSRERNTSGRWDRGRDRSRRSRRERSLSRGRSDEDVSRGYRRRHRRQKRRRSRRRSSSHEEWSDDGRRLAEPHRRHGDREHIETDEELYRRRKRRRRSVSEDRRLRKRRRRRRRTRRSESSSRISTPAPPSPPMAPHRVGPGRRTGVVSDDEADAVAAPPPLPSAPTTKSRSASSRDDTVGHFRGGPGTVIDSRYRVVRDVGLGTFGRVVECLDLRRSRKGSHRGRDASRSHVAIKIVRNVKRYYESARIEAEIVNHVNRRGGRGTSHCAVLYDAFTWTSHYCMVFESLGPSLYDFLKRHNYQPFPMVCIRDFSRQLLETLEFLHSAKLIHTDLKPENILLTNYREVSYNWRGRTYQIPESTKVKVIDFGGATYDDEKKSSVVNTRQYRAPEVILGAGWSMPSDMWSAGCILAELYLGDLLFATHDNVEHLGLIEATIGPFPKRILKRAKNMELVDEVFDSVGQHRLERILPPDSAAYVRKTKPLEGIIRKEERFVHLLRRLLVIDPERRATARESVRQADDL